MVFLRWYPAYAPNLKSMKAIRHFLFLIPILLAGCQGKAPLTGVLDIPSGGEWAQVVYLIQPRHLDELATSFAGQVLDSAIVQADGGFVFQNLPEAPEPILLELAVQKKGERFSNKLEDDDPAMANYFPFIWQNGMQLAVRASLPQFQASFSIANPSPANAALLQLRDIRQAAFQTHLQKHTSTDHDAHALLDEEAALARFRQELMDFAQQMEHLLPALLAYRWVSPLNDYERVPEFLVSQCEKWQARHGDYPWVVELCQMAKREQLPVLQGDHIPDANLPLLSGDSTTLYRHLGSRLTILDLWASWCGPCRRENREVLVPLWEKYQDAGLQIIGYALESSEDTWKKAMEKDGVTRWLQVSHLRGDDAPMMKTLRIQTIPANFILDANGVVVAKNLHGEALVKFVENYLKK
jgi:thiol-disulfide isomerase/thioredoxin